LLAAVAVRALFVAVRAVAVRSKVDARAVVPDAIGEVPIFHISRRRCTTRRHPNKHSPRRFRSIHQNVLGFVKTAAEGADPCRCRLDIKHYLESGPLPGSPFTSPIRLPQK
jgi:hypothetical protein